MADGMAANAATPTADDKMAREGQAMEGRIGAIVAAGGHDPVRAYRVRVAAPLAALAAGGALGGCAWLQTQERRLALRPTPGAPANPDAVMAWRTGDQVFTVPSAAAPGQRLAIWWLPQPDPQAATLLYLHGTLRSLYGNAPKIDALRRTGFAILAVDYRGWGDSTTIVPSEETIVADAWQAWALLQQRQRDPRRRVIYGHSMGSAVAVILASQLRHGVDYGALALESAITRLPDVAAEAGFWGRIGASITTLQFDAIGRIGAVDAPIWMLHGDADKTVPIVLGRRLRDAAPPGVHWTEVPGGPHSRLHEYAPTLYTQTFRELQVSLVAGTGLSAPPPHLPPHLPPKLPPSAPPAQPGP
ncbi:MAG: alpha/beta fold hydrolase [Burkholderiaceae bacterium]|nr:alpha/beta fold hydrolase [Burkholderiaceae bacterium]